ncbi:hypothetical protein [Phyllobacterium sp. P30BS-XVII]|uniref:hypothetical protein n=1 Tax=Phyllobacterium sp. P30BS-XVII TaxID=2587046 RepID=UPI000DD9F70E|nr:hypothetical protein [Phyllobacterium sp. P30BS-XVII]MBA8902417.1 hypothetical protein [Phyllobacterium sp. P30BS-XVII]
MTQFVEGDWFGKSQIRKSVRDEVREAFWAEVGSLPHYEQNAVEAAPQSQRVPIVRLLQVTRDGLEDGDHKAFLVVIAGALRSTGLGIGAMGPVAQNIEDMTKFHTRVLEHFFTHPYKLEGPRDGEFKFD